MRSWGRGEGFCQWVIGYVIAIVIGLVLPQAAVVLYCGIAVYLIVPLREVQRLLSRHS